MCIWGLLRTCLDMTSGLSGVSLLTSRVFRSWTFSSGWVVVLYSSVMSLHLMIFHSVGRSLLTAGYFRSFLWEKVQYIYFFWIGNVTENKSKTNLKGGFFVEPRNLASPDGFRKKFPSSAPNFPSQASTKNFTHTKRSGPDETGTNQVSVRENESGWWNLSHFQLN